MNPNQIRIIYTFLFFYLWTQQGKLKLVAIKTEFDLDSAETQFHFLQTRPLS